MMKTLWEVDNIAFEDGRSVFQRNFLPNLDESSTAEEYAREIAHANFLLGAHAGNLGMDDLRVRSMFGGFYAELAMTQWQNNQVFRAVS